MIKPLLRVLPSLSGNAKLACTVTDSRKVDGEKDTWECSVRGARILPISSHMWQSNIEAGLVSSSWEYDLPKFYAMYSDVFFKPCFQFDKADMLKLDTSTSQKLRATDFEFGVKRISFKKNGKQFAFFAPLYIDNANDLPAYFEIEAKVYSYTKTGKLVYAITKKLRVNIGNEKESKRAYLGRYLDRYLNKIDSRVAFCLPMTNQATYYGIDLTHSGFVTATDNMMDRVYHHQNTIHNFDATIAGAYERNRIAMKQILPLSFYFDAVDFLEPAEQIRYRNSYIEFSGAYFDMFGNELKKYDFSTDYMQFSLEQLKMNYLTGAMQWGIGNVKNIMDVGFPSLNECRYINYEYANKLAPWFCRWKMKHSSDEHPYIMNNSWAFSKNQGSNYKYGTFPATFDSLLGLAKYIQEPKGTYNYNMMLPLGDPEDTNSGRWLYKYYGGDGKEGPYNYIAEDYEQILNEFCTNWFSVCKEYGPSIFENEAIWELTDEDCVYYKGILYDLRNAYERFPDNAKKIDKFAVLLHPEMHVLTEEEMEKLKFSRYTLYRQNVSQISSPNAVANDSVLVMSYLQSVPDYVWDDATFNTMRKANRDELRFNELFVKSAYNEGTFIDMMNATYADAHTDASTGIVSYTYHKYDLDYYDLNKFYAVQDKSRILNVIDENIKAYYDAEDTEMKAMLSSYVIPYYGEPGYLTAYEEATVLSYAWLPVTRAVELTYEAIPDWVFNGSYTYTTEEYIWALKHNNYVINVPPEYADRKYDPDQNVSLIGVMSDMSYIRHSSDKTEMMLKAYVSGEFNGVPYSYLSILDATSENVNYGAQYYWGSYMLSSTYFPYTSSAFDAYSYLAPLVRKMREQGSYEWRYEDLESASLLRRWESLREDAPAAYWAGRIIDWKHATADSISYALSSYDGLSAWEYTPVVKYMDNVVATDVFNERSKWTGNFYGDLIPQSKAFLDNNVLWADPYNLDAIYAYEGYPAYEGGLHIPPDTMYRDMYVKFLNKTHLFYWYVELFKDEKRQYEGTLDFQDFMYNKWYKYLYVVQDFWIYDYEYEGCYQGAPVRRRVYTPLEKFMQFPEYYNADGADAKYRSFNAFYNSVNYSTSDDVFTLPSFYYDRYDIECRRHVEDVETLKPDGSMLKVVTEERPIKFELCFRKKMMRADEHLWGVAHMQDEIDMYRDIYFYRVQNIIEHDEDYSKILPVRMTSDVSYIMWSLSESDTYSYIMPHEHTIIIEDEPVTYYTYTEETAYFDVPHEYTNNPVAYVQESDSMAIPLFNDIFMQPATESLIYTHYNLHDITKASVVEDEPDTYTGEWNVLHTNYRFGQLDKQMMMEISPQERERYSFNDTYDRYDKCYNEMTVISDDLGLGYAGLSTKVTEDGTAYGFYYITSYINNTSNTFNVTGVNEEGSTVSNLRYINMINGVSILKSPDYIATIFKELAPFIKQELLAVMSAATTIIYPDTYPFDMIYSQVPANGAESIGAAETEIIKNSSKLKTQALLRYFHSMTPWITPVTTIQNEWRLKLKDVNAQLLDTGKYLSIGDAPIYSVPVHIDTFTPYTVYTSANGVPGKKDYDNPLEELYTPLEYKFYNDSRAVFLEHKFTYKVPGKLTYEKLLENETDEAVMNAFEKHVSGRTHKRFTDTELVFLLNKYSVSFDSVSVGLDLAQKQKLYELSIVFELL